MHTLCRGVRNGKTQCMAPIKASSAGPPDFLTLSRRGVVLSFSDDERSGIFEVGNKKGEALGASFLST